MFGSFTKILRGKRGRPSFCRKPMGLQRLETRNVLSTAALVDSDLLIIGTSGSDVLQVRTVGYGIAQNAATVERASSPIPAVAYPAEPAAFTIVEANGREIGRFPAGAFKRIQAYSGDGSDKITVDTSLDVITMLDGGNGDDRLSAHGGPAIMLGGHGSDGLHGGDGRDILCGGDGSDTLSGNGGDDLLFAGNIDDTKPVDRWFDLQSIWSQNAPYRTRVKAIVHELGTVPVNYSETAKPGRNFDVLYGGPGLDCYFPEMFSRIVKLDSAEQVF